MTWPVRWPSAANIASVQDFPRRIAELYATTSLTALTLGRVGGNPVTIMPATRDRVPGYYAGITAVDDAYPLGIFYPGTIYPSAQDLHTSVLVNQVEAVVLPGPVAAITEVRVDGAVVPAEKYVLEDGQYLIRTDGAPWPASQGNNFTVSYLNAYEPGDLGEHAAGVLAMEFLKLVSGDRKGCRLPSSVTNVNRQGLTFEVARGMFPEGLTGLPEVDAFILLWNPHGLKVAPRVYSPDVQRPRQVRFP